MLHHKREVHRLVGEKARICVKRLFVHRERSFCFSSASVCRTKSCRCPMARYNSSVPEELISSVGTSLIRVPKVDVSRGVPSSFETFDEQRPERQKWIQSNENPGELRKAIYGNLLCSCCNHRA